MKQGWKTCKFADVFDLQMGKTPSRDNPTYWGDDNMWVSIADMNEQKYMSATKEGITDVAVQESGIKPIPKGTVIMSFKLSIGKVSIATSKLYTNEAIMGFIEKEEGTLVPEYLYYYLKGYKWEGANKAAMGMTLNKKTIAENTISYPPIAEQEKIVSELDCLSGIIEKKKQQLKKLDNLAQSIFYEMFGDPVENDKGWETAKLKDSVIEMFLGPFGSALKTECYVDKDASYCMVYEQKHAIRKTLNLETHYINQSKYNELKRFEVHSGDFIMSCRGTIGEIYRLPNDAPMGIIHPSVMKIRIKEDIYNPIFFNRLLSRIIKNETTSGNCVQMAITAKELGARKPILPPLKIQQDFASKIESIEKQKELIAQSIKETETLFNSRMDYYFN